MFVIYQKHTVRFDRKRRLERLLVLCTLQRIFIFGNLAYFWRISQVFEQIKESLDNFRQARIDIDVDIVIKWTQKCFQKKEIHYRSLEILLTTNREKVLKQIFINVFDRNMIKTKQNVFASVFV